jgi:hypothetical protein
MRRGISTWLSALMLVVLTGCATSLPMALSDAAAPKADKVTVLMSTTIGNDFKPRYQPGLVVVHWEKPEAKEQADRLNFVPDAKSAVLLPEGVAHKSYLLSFELDPGQHLLAGMTSQAMAFPFIGTFFTPLMQNVSFERPGVYYVGHVQAIVRERKEEEMRAGSVIPLIDQAAAGASGGTFDILVEDRWTADEGRFKTAYPALDKAVIAKQLLAPHDQPAVRKRWEAR